MGSDKKNASPEPEQVHQLAEAIRKVLSAKGMSDFAQTYKATNALLRTSSDAEVIAAQRLVGGR